MKRLGLTDWLLLAAFLPITCVLIGLHISGILDGSLAYPSFFFESAATEDDYPVVAGYWLDFPEQSALLIGDRVLQVGDRDTRGMSNRSVVAILPSLADEERKLTAVVERDGKQTQVVIALQGFAVSWFRLPVLLGFSVVALVVLLRAPGRRESQRLFVAFLSFVLFETIVYGGGEFQNNLSFDLFNYGGPLALAFILRWVILFPPEVRDEDRFSTAWAWGLALIWFLARIPLLGPTVSPPENLAFILGIVDSVIAAFVITVISWNYGKADPLGRRRLKWVILGIYVGGLPMLVIPFVSFMAPDRPWFTIVHACAGLATAAIPASLLISIVRYNLFDVDKLLGGTTSHMIFLVIVAVVGEVFIEPLGATAATKVGFDANTAQLVFVGGLAVLLYPAERRWRDVVNRVFFPGAQSLDQGVEDLLVTIGELQDASAVLEHLGVSLDVLFQPTNCAVYAAGESSFSPAFTAQMEPAPELTDYDSLKHALATRLSPIQLDARGGAEVTFDAGPVVGSILANLGVAVLVPLRPHGEATAFICLGARLSGDVYTTTDLALLSSVAHAASSALARG